MDDKRELKLESYLDNEVMGILHEGRPLQAICLLREKAVRDGFWYAPFFDSIQLIEQEILKERDKTGIYIGADLDEIKQLIQAQDKIAAIKVLRAKTDISMKNALDFVHFTPWD